MKENNLLEEKLDSLIQLYIPSATMGATALVSLNGKIVYEKSFGEIKELNFKYHNTTIYDLASLTKPLVTSLLTLKLLDNGTISLGDNVGDFNLNPELKNVNKFTIENLLAHTSGLIPDKPLYIDGKNRDSYLKSIDKEAINAVPYVKESYSDLNFILLGFILEKIYGDSLDVIWEERIAKPLNLKNSFFNPTQDKNSIAPTEKTQDRGLVWGKVHDEKSYYLGGVAGHAGLFSTASDINTILFNFINEKIVSRKTMLLATSNRNEYLNGQFGLGWMTKVKRPKKRSDAFDLSGFFGDYSSLGVFGHTGFTGTSICIDRELGLICVLLTNRVYPTRDNLKIIRLRRLFHNNVNLSLFS